MSVCGTFMTDVLSLFSAQKSFSLVLEALDYDNDTSESGEATIHLFVCVYVRLWAFLNPCLDVNVKKTVPYCAVLCTIVPHRRRQIKLCVDVCTVYGSPPP